MRAEIGTVELLLFPKVGTVLVKQKFSLRNSFIMVKRLNWAFHFTPEIRKLLETIELHFD